MQYLAGKVNMLEKSPNCYMIGESFHNAADDKNYPTINKVTQKAGHHEILKPKIPPDGPCLEVDMVFEYINGDSEIYKSL